MSKIRNRSVKTLPHEFANILNHLNKNQNYQDEDYFGENIKDVNRTSPYVPFFRETPPQSFSIMSNSDVDSITLDLNKLSGLSSSSSLSWSDEYESETTKKIQCELERMDRVLRREEPIPPDYDKDEYEQWMSRFPNLSIFDSQITPVNSIQNIPKMIEEEEKQLIIYGNDKNSLLNKDCDNTLTSNNKKKKPLVIDVSDSLSNGSLKHRSANTARKRRLEENKNRSRNIFTISHKPRSLDADRYLKISPIKNQVCERRLSTRSLKNREISKEYPDISTEYNSLPFIKVEESNFSKSNTASSRSKDSSGQLARKRLESNLILPPIATSNQFRSISATPRQGSKTFSALSMKFENLKNKKSSISFIENPISNR